MKSIIQKLIEENPRTYVKKIKNDKKLYDWILENSIASGNHFPSHVYSAIHNESNICKRGNQKKFKRWSVGFVGCGPANVCDCTKEYISKNVKNTKNQYSKEKKETINKKRSRTMMETYGVGYNSQRTDIKYIWKKPKIPNDVFLKLSDYNWLDEQYNKLDRSAVDIARELNIYYSTVIDHCKKHGFIIKQKSNYSLVEIEICEFLRSHGISIQTNVRNILNGKEIDIFVESYNLGIEVNGLYWHSYHPSMNDFENKNRHLEKTKISEKYNIELIHITDWEWYNKKDIIKSLLISKLGISKKIHARKTKVNIVNSKIARAFLEENHIQGKCSSSIYLGLHYNNQLVMVISAGRNRFGKKYELHRFATLKYHTVVGGASKLLSHLRKYINTDHIISYCDQDKSIGNIYKSLGFSFLRETGPGYFWTNGTEIFSRYKCQKKNLKNWLKTYDPNKSESENLFDAGYRRYWNTGNLVFEYYYDR